MIVPEPLLRQDAPALPAEPLAWLHGRGIVCLSTIDWDFLWQRQQELMSRFARAGVPVVYVEPLGVRSARLSDVRKVGKRVGRWLRHGVAAPATPGVPGLERVSPYALPVQGSALIDDLNARLVARTIGAACRRRMMARPLVWVYYATPVVHRLLDRLAPSLLVYDCIDDIARNARGVAPGYAAAEAALCARADALLATSSALWSERRALNAATHLVPPGVDMLYFGRPQPEPPALAALPHPRLGFFGGIDERLDLSLLAQAARARPDWTLVLIGVVRTDVTVLRGLSNVVFIPQQAHRQLPGYVQHLDVLLLPYVLNDYTKRIYPAKVFECLATGKPVVATALPDLLPFSGSIRLAERGDAVAHIAAALSEDPAQAAARQAVAAANTWDSRFRAILDIIDQARQRREDTR